RQAGAHHQGPRLLESLVVLDLQRNVVIAPLAERGAALTVAGRQLQGARAVSLGIAWSKANAAVRARHLVEGQDAPEELAVRADSRGLERDVIYADDGLLGRDERRREVADRSEEASRVGAWLGPGYGRRLPLDDSQPQPVRVLESQVLSSQPVRCYVGDVRFRESRAPALQRAWRYTQGDLARARRAWVPGAGTGP